jgi:hypothetical protein
MVVVVFMQVYQRRMMVILLTLYSIKSSFDVTNSLCVMCCVQSNNQSINQSTVLTIKATVSFHTKRKMGGTITGRINIMDP